MPSRVRSEAPLCRLLGSVAHAAAILGLALAPHGSAPSRAAEPSPAAPEGSGKLPPAELEELVAPIALYPDELLALALPASTYPLEIVQAARLLERRKTEPDAPPDESWDTSIIGLMNYPEVVALMNDDLNWTWKLGEAVANQQEDVMDSVQRFRAKVDGAGNLASNDKQTVVKESQGDQQIIIIESASPEVIYVPQYEPSVVVVQQTAPYPYYYSPPYPYYYNPAAAFWTGMFVGAAVGWGMSWGWGWGHSNIDIDRNVNIDIDRPTRPERPSQTQRDRGTRDKAGGGQRWQPDPNRGKVGGRPGGDRTAARPSTPGASRPGAAARPSTGTGARPGASQRAGSGTRPSTGSRPSAASRPSTRAATSSMGGHRSAGSGSFGSYGSGRSARASASRGSMSRAGRGGGGGRRR